MTEPAPLRIGVLTDGDEIPGWLGEALDEVSGRHLAEVVLVVERAPAEPGPAVPRLERLWRNRAHLGFALLDRLDRRRVPKPAGPRWTLSDIAPRAERIVVRPKATRFSDLIEPADVARIREHRIDVLVRAGFRILRGEILRDAAAHGVWSFHHGDNRTNRGGPPGVWEVLEDRETTGVTLQRLTEDLDGGTPLARSVGATQRFSFARNVAYLYPRSARLLVRSLERLHAGRDPRQSSGLGDPPWDAYSAPLYRLPTNRDLLHHLPRLAVRYLSRRLDWVGRRATWSVAWHFQKGIAGNTPHGSLFRYQELRPPRDRFWADPFVVRDGARWWMFFEELEFATSHGVIAAWEMGPGGPVGTPRTVLRTEGHLSYPFVFAHEGAWYMLPETFAAGRLELYRAERFPDEWVLDRVLMELRDAVDATLHEEDGRWYLFTSVGDIGIDYGEELHLYVAESPFGPFTPHPASPVTTDVRGARMAGRIFRQGGRLFRPGQRGVPMYGSGITVHEILTLSPSEYAERAVHRLEPRWRRDLHGLHTINAADGLSVIDLLRSERK